MGGSFADSSPQRGSQEKRQELWAPAFVDSVLYYFAMSSLQTSPRTFMPVSMASSVELE